MGFFDDPNMAALAAAAGAFGDGAMPSRMPIPFGATLGHAASAAFQGAGNAQDYQAKSMQNQMAQLGLDRAKTMQPYFMKQIMGGNTGGMGVPTSEADQKFQMAYNLAMMSGKSDDAAKVMQSWAEHNPSLAGQIEAEKNKNTLYKTPQGTYVKGAQINSGGAPQGGGTLPNGQLDNQYANNQPDKSLYDVLNTVQPSKKTEAQIIASDGKPLLPGHSNLFQPDPTGSPRYQTDNTETGVNQTKLFQESDMKANEAFTANASSLQNEQFRLKELADVYKQVQAGTLTAQNPELANKLIAWGVIQNPAQIKDVAGIQNALQSHALQIIQQIKDTNANLGGAPTRTFGSEIQNLQEKGESPSAQPEALWNIIGQAKGIVDHHLDMVKGWDTIGGLGNRQANGYTLRPDDYARKFISSHDITDYKTKAQTDMGPFAGMGTRVKVQTPDGKPGTLDSKHLKELIAAGGKVVQ